MTALARFVVAHRWWVIGAWLLLAVAGGYAAPKATAALTFDFGLPGQSGYETNQRIAQDFGSGGDNAPVLVVVDAHRATVAASTATTLAQAVERAAPASRIASYADHPSLLAHDRHLGALLVYPRVVPGADPYAHALPAIRDAVAHVSTPAATVTVTGQDAVTSDSSGGGSGVLAETLFGAVGALVVLVIVFGSFLAVLPLVIAGGSILTTFLVVWGLTGITDVSAVVQYLLALIGLGVAIDYALLVVTRWREERGNGVDNDEAVRRALPTAGRSVLFSGITVAVSLAALIALPVPFLRSIGFTGLLIPVISVAAALTLLPALLSLVGPRLAWPHRRSPDPDSRLWHRIAGAVTRHRAVAIVGSLVVLLALAAPVLGLRVGAASNTSLASTGGASGTALTRLDDAGLGRGLTHPVEIVTHDPQRVRAALTDVDGVASVVAPDSWRRDGRAVVDAWTTADTSTDAGREAAARIRAVARETGSQVGGTPAQDADFVHAVYGNAWWIGIIIVVVTLLLLARAVRSIVLPIKALVLNALSIAAAYGVTVLIWQHGVGTEALFGQSSSGAITIWLPIAAFAFLFGLSMDYEVFLLTRIREERDAGHDTVSATVRGTARTGRLISSAALILFLAFVALSRVPESDVKILATALAFGIAIDATVVRGVLAPALVAALGRANWWWPGRAGARHRDEAGKAAPTPTIGAQRVR